MNAKKRIDFFNSLTRLRYFKKTNYSLKKSWEKGEKSEHFDWTFCTSGIWQKIVLRKKSKKGKKKKIVATYWPNNCVWDSQQTMTKKEKEKEKENSGVDILWCSLK